MPLQHRSKYVGMEPPGEVGNSSDQYDYSFIPPAADPPVEPDVDEEKVRVPISRRKKSGLKLLCLVSLIAVVAFTQLAQTHWVVPSLDSLPALALKKVQTQKPVLAMIEDKEPNKVKKKKREMGYVTVLFEDTKHLCGALMMAWSLNDRDQFHDLVAVISGELDSPENFVFAKKVLQKAGFRLYDMPLLKGPTQKQHWFKYRYSKLNAVRLKMIKRKKFRVGPISFVCLMLACLINCCPYLN